MGVGVRAPGHHRERSATERLQALREGRDLDDEFAYEIPENATVRNPVMAN